MRLYQLESHQGATRSIDYERALNDEQRAVVMAPFKPTLVIAGAGSGKTRTLVYRLARMLESSIQPERIRLLTFTNRAAHNMLERAQDLCPQLAGRVVAGTFHKVALRDLFEHAHHLGYQDRFSIVSRDDAKEILDGLLDKAKKASRSKFPSADVILEMISFAINTQSPIDQIVYKNHPRFYAMIDEIAQIARRYFEKKLEMNVMDFDDILINWHALLKEHEHVAQLIRGQIDAVLVDEYQDTNALQGEIVHMLAQDCHNITVVGDDAQSIYGFRGAMVENMWDFETRFRDTARYMLVNNYRSTPQILNAANHSLQLATQAFSKQLVAHQPDGELPVVVACQDAVLQAQFVAQRTLELIASGVPLNEIAVLYRAHHHAMELQLELMRRQIPFVVRSGLRFFDQAHIKDVLAYLKLVYNPKDQLSFLRAIKQHRGIGPAYAERIWEHVRAHDSASWGDALKSYPAQKGAHSGVMRFAHIMQGLCTLSLGASPKEHLEFVMAHFYQDYLSINFTNADQRKDDVRQLCDYAASFTDLASFLQDLMLVSDIEVAKEEADDTQGKITLSSIHQAKGLEWSQVFVLWLCEGRFPSERALKEAGGNDAERRLFYVAATRAKVGLYLCHPMLHRSQDMRCVLLAKSRFVEELQKNTQQNTMLVENWVVEAPKGETAPCSTDSWS